MFHKIILSVTEADIGNDRVLFDTTHLLMNLKLAGTATKGTMVMDFVKDC